MKKNRVDITVQWGDCDPADIVFFPNYFRWFDTASSELFASVGIDMATIFDEHGILGTPILDTGAKFMRPSRFRDVITIESTIESWGKSSFRIKHIIYNGGEEAVIGHEVRAWVKVDETHPNGIRAIPIPDSIRAKFE